MMFSTRDIFTLKIETLFEKTHISKAHHWKSSFFLNENNSNLGTADFTKHFFSYEIYIKSTFLLFP